VRNRIVTIASVIVLVVVAIMFATQAQATTPTINVDGVEYQATQVSGPVWHFETPDVNPTAAFTDRNVWNGINGAEWLPCEGGIHWIDNENLLTISHCLEGGTTTTTSSTTTTSTTLESTTTTTTSSTTTTEATTTTTDPTTTTSSSTTIPKDTTTTTTILSTTLTTALPTTTTIAPTTTSLVSETTTVVPVTPELPKTGAPIGVLFAAGLGLVILGSLAIRAAVRRD